MFVPTALPTFREEHVGSMKKPLEKRVWTLALVTCALLVAVAVVRKGFAAPE